MAELGNSYIRSRKIASTPTQDDIVDPVLPTTSNMSIPPELFEQMYLAPKTTVKGDLRQMFGNPTPTSRAP